MPSTLDPTTGSSSGRKSLIERLASLRIQSSSTSPSQTSTKPSSKVTTTESPRYIPRSAQSTLTTKSKFYNYPQHPHPHQQQKQQHQHQQDSNELLASPSIGRRRKLNGISTTNSTNSITAISSSTAAACPFDSPKYFPKQKFVEIHEKASKFPEIIQKIEDSDTCEIERNHSVKRVVTSFIDSFAILNNFLSKISNSTSAKLHLQNMSASFAALQMDLKAAVSQLNEISAIKSEISILRSENSELKTAKSKDLSPVSDDELKKKNQELQEQLSDALNQLNEIKNSFTKEKENVEFLQNYMEEIIQLKDEAERNILILEKQKGNPANLSKENETLKETIRLLEMERLSSKNVCEEAIKVLDSTENLDAIKQELKLKQAEIEKLKGREQHFKESNEIFQQKLLLLTEENRKLKGQRPLNHY